MNDDDDDDDDDDTNTVHVWLMVVGVGTQHFVSQKCEQRCAKLHHKPKKDIYQQRC